MLQAKRLAHFLHPPSNLLKIVDDLVEEVRIVWKHSYENTIIPVPDFQARFGSRIAVVGGHNNDILGASSAEESG